MIETNPNAAGASGPPSGFAAFISYSQKDARLAKRLHLALKAYRVPKGVKVPGLNKDRSLGRIFRDDENMGADPSLRDALNALVDSARNLIVLCTPNSARSPWVDQEVRRFKRRENPRIFAVIGSGVPNAEDLSTECFAPALKSKLDSDGKPTGEPDEPLAPNLQKESFAKVRARIAAGLLGVSFDELWQFDRRRRRRRIAAVLASFGLVCATLTVAVVETLNAFDAAALVTQSVQTSTDAWRRGSDDAVFHGAFRAALAAILLREPSPQSSGVTETCDLRGPVRTGICAVALSGHALGHVRLFDERPNEPRGNFRDDIAGARGIERRAMHLSDFVRHVAFSGDSKRIAMFHVNGRLQIINVAQRQVMFDGKIDGAKLGPVAMNESGTFAVLPGRDNKLVVVDVKDGARRQHDIPAVAGQDVTVYEAIVNGSTWTVVVTRRSNGQPASSILLMSEHGVGREIPIEEYTPDDSNGFSRAGNQFIGYSEILNPKLFVVGVQKATMSFIEVPDLAKGLGQVKALATDPDARWVALGGNGSGGTDNAAQVISLNEGRTQGRESTRLTGHTGEIYTIAFGPDADLVATGSSDLTVRLWHRATGREIARLAGHASDIKQVAISPDGTMLATTASDQTVFLWDLTYLAPASQRSVHAQLCTDRRPGFARPSTTMSMPERQSTREYVGRPWDLCDWQGSGTLGGFLQSLRAVLVRYLAIGMVDYSAPQR